MTVKEKILKSLEPVLKAGVFVTIDESKIPILAKKLENIPIPDLDEPLQFSGNSEEIAQYLFFLDSSQGCLWQMRGKERWYFKINGQWQKGYYAFAYAIKKAFLADRRFYDASYLSEISFEDFSKIFDGKNELLLMAERCKNIRENFKILKDKYGGKALNLVLAAEGDVNKLVEMIIDDFPSFRDVSEFNGQKVYFLKRAQLFVSDISFALSSSGISFKNIGDLTVFVDYKLPQLLQDEGVLVYTIGLRNRISSFELIEKDSQEELEIRANTISACEKLLLELKKIGRNLTSNNLDWMLWVASKQKDFSSPYHRTITTDY